MIKVLSSRQYNQSLKATVQQTGKLSFNVETGAALGLTSKKGVKFFMGGEPEQLCLAIMAEPDEDAFTLKKSGAYFTVEAKLLFDELGIDYKTYTVFYDLVRCKAYDAEAGGECYKMNYRPIPKKKSSNGEDVSDQ